MNNIRYERVKIGDLTAYPGNARTHNLDVIKESLQTHGQYRPLVVQESTGYVLAGNGTREAAASLGWEHIDIGVVDVDDDQARRIVLVDNRSNDLAGYDDQALADLLTEVEGELTGTGFTDDDLNSLLATLGPGGFSHDELGMVIKVPTDPTTKTGDLIEMGPHLLYCGDCHMWSAMLQQDEVAYERADMIWTDPPYLIAYQTGLSQDEAKKLHRRTDGKEVANEDMSPEMAYKFRMDTALLVYNMLKAGGVYYMHVPPGPDQAMWIHAMELNHLLPRQVIQWVKDQFVFGRSDYHYRSEPILYGWREGAAHQWNGGRSQDSVWEFDRPKRSKDHPTIKPVELAMKAIENSSTPGEVVLDPFAGSGTILPACMQTGRRALMLELDPGYCDVIVERWERLTGEPITRRSWK